MTLVIDASALVRAGVGTDVGAKELRTRLVAEDCHAPHLIDAEVGDVLRRRARRGKISSGLARLVLREVSNLIDFRYAHTGEFATRAWELRENLTIYDALYVALASSLNTVLITVDRQLAAVAEAACAVDLIADNV
ncbi:MAG: PIN domain-containing protein [Jiangellaceae bacterium]|nr:PIN domain-containing protein [Jiangellaceae bacterium]